MVTPTQIGQAGEAAAVAALKEKGWTITTWNTQSPGSTDIEAASGGKKLLVQAKAAVSPGAPTSLSGEEEQNIKSRATRIGADAYEVRVALNQALAPVSLNWRKLT